MEIILSIFLGACLMLLIQNKGINITINHVSKKPILNKEVPKMSEILSSVNNKEDSAYEEMGAILNELNDVMLGGNAHAEK